MTIHHATPAFDFTTHRNHLGDRSSKWGNVDTFLGKKAAPDTLAMWLAQMDFQPSPFLQNAMDALRAEGEYGYFIGLDRFFARISWWYETRHGWSPDPAHMFVTHGIGNAIGITLQAMTEPGDGIIIFSPVYNEFQAKIQRNGRNVVSSKLVVDDAGLYRMDLASLKKQLTGREKAVLFSTPHNPAGRVWETQELNALADFCLRHDLLLISDEIHHDLAFPDSKHVPTAVAAPQILPNLIAMSAASKTFDIAGLRTGYVIIPGEKLRARFGALHKALDIQANRAGLELTCAAYTAEGAAWVDGLMAVLNTNRRIFCDGINAIPGMSAMPMQSTFLAWVDFDAIGMSSEEIHRRITSDARLVPSPGKIFGLEGNSWCRFNIGAPTSVITEAVARLQAAFADLQ